MLDMSLNKEERKIIDIARTFARDHVAPRAAAWEAKRQVPLDTLSAAAKAGLAGMLVPKAYGGHGLSHVAVARVMEEMASACMAFTFSLVVHNNLAGNIARNGTKALADKFLPSMLKAERIGAFCLTEPAGGSDAAAITTSAEKTDTGWTLNGAKAWITNGAVADVISVYAQTDPKRGWRGIGCFLVEADNPGVKKEPAYALMGGHAMGTNGLSLDNCRIPESYLLLGPGAGFKAAMVGINIARVYVGAMCCGMMQASLDRAIAYAKERKAFGATTASFQGLQWLLADVATDLQAARLLTYRAAAVMDKGEAAMVEAAHAKKFATRAALKGIADCMQAMGAAGFRAEYSLGRHLANAKMTQYLDGTTEIQNVVISRALFGSSP